MSFLKALQKADSCFDVETSLTHCLCDLFSSGHTLAISMAISNHEWGQLKNLAPDPKGYMDRDDTHEILNSKRIGCRSNHVFPDFPGPTQFKTDRLASRLLVKSGEVPTGIPTDQEAKVLFLSIEEKLAEREHLPRLRAPWLLTLSRQINDMLSVDGSQFLTPEVLEEIVTRGRVGPGGSTNVASWKPKSEKLRSKTSYTPQISVLLPAIKSGLWEMEQPLGEPTPSVEVKTVSKTAFIDRTVAAMPVANMFVQLGLASILEDRLRRVGIDIRDQTRNQNLAKRARSLGLATIDLSSASSWFQERNLVEILPPDLLHMLDLIRPHAWHFSSEDGEQPVVHRFHNWMPMGCGYTFSLMTLYFYALVRSIVPESALSFCSVYGDDIILPQKYAKELVERLEYLGFEVNREKSYLNGNFFESCGTEWFADRDVLPFYCRKGADSDSGIILERGVAIPYRIQLANRLRLWAAENLSTGCADKKVKAVWEALHKPVPRHLKPPVPPHLGDVGLITSLEESRYERYNKAFTDGWEDVYSVSTMRKKQATVFIQDPFPYLVWLMQHMEEAPSEPLNCRLVRGRRGFGTLRYSLQDLFNTDVELKTSMTFTTGIEPLRGHFSASESYRVITRWPAGLEWVDTRKG